MSVQLERVAVRKPSFLFFFFQAEDGIRDADVTGVQTCALPISRSRRFGGSNGSGPATATRKPPKRRERGGGGGGGAPGALVSPIQGTVLKVAVEKEIGRASCRERVENSGVAGG